MHLATSTFRKRNKPLAMWGSEWMKYRILPRLIAAVAAIVCVVVAVGYILGLVREGHHGRLRVGCDAKGGTINMCLHTYVHRHESFPPSLFKHDNGAVQHSWRLLILEGSSSHRAFDRYDFTLPWDSESNLSVAKDDGCIYSYHCPLHGSDESLVTQYLAVTGEQTVFPPGGTTRLDEITDGPENTIVFLEVPDSTVLWSEPRDLTRAEAIDLLCGERKGTNYMFDRHGILIGFADGRTERLRKPLPRRYAEAFTSIAGGENVERSSLIEDGYFFRGR